MMDMMTWQRTSSKKTTTLDTAAEKTKTMDDLATIHFQDATDAATTTTYMANNAVAPAVHEDAAIDYKNQVANFMKADGVTTDVTHDMAHAPSRPPPKVPDDMMTAAKMDMKAGDDDDLKHHGDDNDDLKADVDNEDLKMKAAKNVDDDDKLKAAKDDDGGVLINAIDDNGDALKTDDDLMLKAAISYFLEYDVATNFVLATASMLDITLKTTSVLSQPPPPPNCLPAPTNKDGAANDHDANI
eukprot:CAMPEP_0172486266 /NCGR_PEP_ID=MMETSP1066-20121228/14781_1 /TAXON_ID=671091 /ORGANISM="Coscinodiscus wailesii, Strain CCMP2513" /LENGTH=242 /DNA_ID=CAMNT_0013252111 /DNA_START=8 /DNA_END=733 /DNA_ORIENTATION=+